ncbi:PTS sugar transporter subunit IIC [Virgibacillus sp. NKC19-3]|uniref:PTS sugar transporter subunit IIC n=1 Tax=Virgibacillus saliphilus TaxID=2831674 RepID=UPI001C9ABE47|nr:PTS transporter subunit EIIC [Virgibacillus sp. NKC19-3]MBY7144485.1 PTS sugar transporter subunit IIC [Virgibacillus sp. NKC19-3]
MNRIANKLAEWLMPVANKFSNQRHLSSVKEGFITIIPLVIVASFFILINNVILDPEDGILGGVVDLSYYKEIGDLINNGTLGILSILIAFTVAYKLAVSYNEDGVISGAMAVAVLITMLPNVIQITPEGSEEAVNVTGVFSQDDTSATGLIFAIIAALLGTEVFLRLKSKKKLQIKMPDSVPPAVGKSFSALIPAFLTLTFFAILVFLSNALFGFGLQELVSKLIQAPLDFAIQSEIGISVIMFVQNLLWSLGIHGTFVLGPIKDPSLYGAIQENINALQAGADIPNIVTKPFVDSFAMLGGGGFTLGLMIAILIASRRKDYREVTKFAFIPGLFNINEPLMFGLPVILNPILAIPLIIVPIVNLNIAYLATSLGLISKTVAFIPWTTPPVLSAFLSTAGDWRAAVLSIILIGISVIIYLPFVMAANKMTNIEH